MHFSCDDSKISCDDKLNEASNCITGDFRALRHSSVLWDAIFRRPSRLQANTSLLLDLAAHLVLNEFQLILLHQTCVFAISSPLISCVHRINYPKESTESRMSKGWCDFLKSGTFCGLPCKSAVMLVPTQYRSAGWVQQYVSSPAF